MRILTLLLGIILRGDGEKHITAFRLGLPHSPGKSPLTMQRESLHGNQCSWSWLPALTPLWSGNHSLVRVEVWILCLLVGVMPQLSYSLSGGSSYFIKKKKICFYQPISLLVLQQKTADFFNAFRLFVTVSTSRSLSPQVNCYAVYEKKGKIQGTPPRFSLKSWSLSWLFSSLCLLESYVCFIYKVRALYLQSRHKMRHLA